MRKQRRAAGRRARRIVRVGKAISYLLAQKMPFSGAAGNRQ
jgi:hypothetical protein